MATGAATTREPPHRIRLTGRLTVTTLVRRLRLRLMQRWCNRNGLDLGGRERTYLAGEGLHGVSDAVVVGRLQVRVGVEGLAGVGVAECLLDRLDRAAGGR